MKMTHQRPNENSGPLFEIANSWLSTNDVAKILSISPNAVRILVCRGRLPAHKLGRHLRFRQKDCSALVKKTGA
jgi:excisionase family DNA binding protein